MPTSISSRRHMASTVVALADAASWYLALALVALVLLSALWDGPGVADMVTVETTGAARPGGKLVEKPCDEIYVVGEGETLHTISDKCGDPYVVEQNPHIHDPDDVYPGLVIKITPSKSRR